MIYVKTGVVIYELPPKMYEALPVIQRVWGYAVKFNPTIENFTGSSMGVRSVNMSNDKKEFIRAALVAALEDKGYTVTLDRHNQHGEQFTISWEE